MRWRAHSTAPGWTWVALLLVVLWGLSACGGRAITLQPVEQEAVVWLIEDLAHGNPRDPGSLVAAHASDGQLRLALWLGSQSRNEQVVALPAQLQQRVDRWGLLRRGLRAGSLRSEGGRLVIEPGLDLTARGLYLPMVQAENKDRRVLDQLLLAQTGLARGSAQATDFLTALRRVRSLLDTDPDAAP